MMKRKTVIFDFDDTLVQSYPLFLHYEALFLDEMEKLGFGEREEIRGFLRQRDIALVTEAGYPAIDCFPKAIRETYQHFCDKQGLMPDEQIGARLEKQAWQVHYDKSEPVPGAKEVLEALQGRLPLLVFSQGEEQSQLRRIRESGFASYFFASRVVPSKTLAAFEQLIADYDIDAASSWMIGNSLRADVKPALAAGLNAIHYDTHDWAFEQAEVLGHYHRVQRLTDILEILLS